MAKLLRGSVVVGAALALSIALAACSGGSGSTASGSPEADSFKRTTTPTPAPTLVSLDGDWKQSNSNSTDSWQAATITGDTIVVSWVTGGGTTTSLYWAGSVTPPDTATNTFTWTSNNDTSKTENSLLASSDPTKVFTYDNGVIRYPVAALDTTTTVRLTREK
ncbi:hypothetical protein ACX9R5_01255 [Rathayibacter sp. CAU 1779]